jgi:hypothetical protein
MNQMVRLLPSPDSNSVNAATDGPLMSPLTAVSRGATEPLYAVYGNFKQDDMLRHGNSVRSFSEAVSEPVAYFLCCSYRHG